MNILNPNWRIRQKSEVDKAWETEAIGDAKQGSNEAHKAWQMINSSNSDHEEKSAKKYGDDCSV